MKPLTICYTTAREKPEIGWFLDSLSFQMPFGITVLNIDASATKRSEQHFLFPAQGEMTLRICAPKPSYWQGPSRLPKANWWAVANARNTALCLCNTEWVAFLDDRCVLLPGWLNAVERAMEGNYIVAGAYEKRTGMTVENGVIRHGGIVSGQDEREKYVKDNNFPTPFPCPGQWMFGCSLALPLEWALQANGYSETLTDGLGFEDVPFGLVCESNGFPIRYDPTMKIIEDRTPELCGPVMRRTDRGVSPKDKSHKVLDLIAGQKQSPNPFDLRKMREHIQAGNPFPPPSGPTTDWFDGRPIADFV